MTHRRSRGFSIIEVLAAMSLFPARNFDFDTDFQQVQNLPPLTPQVVSVRQILFTANFR